ncbi:alpha-aminoadipic semialdehyde synthase, mitochondrial-like [Bolinopsis microptera]|uniref:alpha-aminoadipic semialdehyde synthase, mitochondrial-like n=1 Tax=Bolinopsis microptera TaxID=2820187 RepID=UPI00307A0E0E
MFLTRASSVARRQSAALSRFKTTLAIRRETINVWERRAPLAPHHVKDIVDTGVNVLVQPSTRRAYYMQEYEEVGAVITEDISSATHIIGVKAPEPEELIEDKCYAFFSHTIKAQPEGMPLLDEMLRKNITLLDYEKMTNEDGTRNVAFGHYAGVAGMINVLHGLGLRMLSLGVTSPFLHIGLAHNYATVADVVPVLHRIGESMKKYKLPKVIAPLTFSFTGSGNVSQGARSIFEHLPHEYIEPTEMKQAALEGDPSICYATVLRRSNSMERIDGKPYSADDYNMNGDLYKNIFAEKVAPYTTCLVNGLYWEAPAPRVLSDEDAVRMFGKGSQAKNNIMRGIPQIPHKMLAISDITCDIGGSIEFSKEPTTVGSPFQLYDPKTRTVHSDFSRDGVMVMSIDNLPCQLPREATEYFGDCLMPHLADFLSLTHDESILSQANNTSPCISRAIITNQGDLAPDYKYISLLRKEQELQRIAETAGARSLTSKEYRSDNKRVLLLGSGLVSEPVVEYLTRSADVRITIGSNDEAQATALASKYRNTVPQHLDVGDRRNLSNEIAKHDLVISLLPATMHAFVAELCIDARRNMLTASYASDQMRKLGTRAAQKGVILFNEIGLDPGIDHLMAMNLFDDIKQNNGTVESFESFCGGLPAPQFTNNPLRYKFTWFPKGVVTNALSDAKYLKDGKEVVVESGTLMQCARPFEVMPGFNLECYPNRDSTIYKEAYGIEAAHTVLRGTLRYKGYSMAMDTLIQLGFFKSDKMDLSGYSWANLTKQLLGNRSMSHQECKKKLLTLFSGDRFRASTIVKLGLLDNDNIPAGIDNPMDALVEKISSSLMLPEDETDVIIMNHSVGVRLPSGKCETHRSNMVVYGEEGGWTAMCKTVGLPVGIAAEMIMNGEIKERGLVLPFTKEIYKPMLKKLELEGITERREVESEDL